MVQHRTVEDELKMFFHHPPGYPVLYGRHQIVAILSAGMERGEIRDFAWDLLDEVAGVLIAIISRICEDLLMDNRDEPFFFRMIDQAVDLFLFGIVRRG
jgi:hypothetical protein